MSIEGFLRLVWPFALELGVSLLVIWFAFRMLLTRIPDKERSKAKLLRLGIMLLMSVILGTWFLTTAGINLFPRTDIDHSDLNQQNQQWEQQHSK